MPIVASAEALTVPPGTRVLHIGPHKTGTTALQGALWLARDAMEPQGVRYPGKARHAIRPMFAVTGRLPPGAAKPPPITVWEHFLADVGRVPAARVIISSEGYCFATEEVIGRIVRDLDPERVHVLITLRPVGRLLASWWQQLVQGGLRLDYEPWLEEIFGNPDSVHAKSFWYRQRHDELVARWAAAAGPGRVTVFIVDEQDHSRLYRDTEALLGLRTGTLAPEADLLNRSLTLEEISALRALREQFAAEDLTGTQFDRLVRMEAGPYLKARKPGPAEHKLETPRWALEAASEVSMQIRQALAVSDARIHGEIARLAGPSAEGAPEHVTTSVMVPPEVAASIALAVARAGGMLQADGASTSGASARAGGIRAPASGHGDGATARKGIGDSVARRLRRGMRRIQRAARR